jgi:hypothetical protein
MIMYPIVAVKLLCTEVALLLYFYLNLWLAEKEGTSDGYFKGYQLKEKHTCLQI